MVEVAVRLINAPPVADEPTLSATGGRKRGNGRVDRSRCRVYAGLCIDVLFVTHTSQLHGFLYAVVGGETWGWRRCWNWHHVRQQSLRTMNGMTQQKKGSWSEQKSEGNPVFLPFPYVSLAAGYLVGWLKKLIHQETESYLGQLICP